MLKEKAYAKINLFLDVLAKRDDFYHDLEMVMAPIALHDTLRFTKTEKADIEIISNIKITERKEDNLVYRVAHFMMETFQLDAGLKIIIDKQIPMAAGLAGGSANAAATLRGINRLFKLNLSLQKLAEIGAQFGSDIPYCIYNRLCIARGKGEQLFFLKNTLKAPVLIVVPPLEVSTKKVYETVDMKEVNNRKITTMTNAIYNRNYSLMVQELYNALEPFTFTLFPEVKKLKETIAAFNVEGVLMSGSGPALFVFHKDKNQRTEIINSLPNETRVIMTKIKA